MKRKRQVDMDKIAKALGAERRGTVRAGSGHFGAMQLVAEVQSRFQTPPSGGRRTDPEWTEKRLVPLAPDTLARLERLANKIREKGASVSPLQVAALLLEHAIDEVDDQTTDDLARKAAS